MKITLYNGVVLSPLTVQKGGIVIEDGRISRIFQGEDFEKTGELIDCEGQFISPGFVDIHTHGIYGNDTMYATPEALHAITRLHAGHGTTALCATTLSGPYEEVHRALENIAQTMKLPADGAKILGAHLEGNYFNPVMAGAQNPEYLYPPQEEEYLSYVKTGCVKRIAAAPEIPGALEMARKLAPMGIQFSIGHSDGTPEDVERAVAAGYTSITHIFNAESGLRSVMWFPEFGVSEMALLRDEIRVECICDGNHLSPNILKLIYKVKGADGMIGITDSIFCGAPNGFYSIGGIEFEVTDQLGTSPICVRKDHQAFGGSMATMDLCVRTLYKQVGIPIQDAVAICSLTPAKVLGMQHTLGMLAPGRQADVNVFDDDINVKMTFIDGRRWM